MRVGGLPPFIGISGYARAGSAGDGTRLRTAPMRIRLTNDRIRQFMIRSGSSRGEAREKGAMTASKLIPSSRYI